MVIEYDLNNKEEMDTFLETYNLPKVKNMEAPGEYKQHAM